MNRNTAMVQLILTNAHHLFPRGIKQRRSEHSPAPRVAGAGKVASSAFVRANDAEARERSPMSDARRGKSFALTAEGAGKL